MEKVPLSPTGHLLHKATIPRQGDIADLPNTQKQIQRGSQNEETKKHTPNVRTEESPRERTKLNGDNLPYSEFRTVVMRMLNKLRMDELSGNLNKGTVTIKKNTVTIKRNQSEMKNTLRRNKEEIRPSRGLNW